MLSIANYIANFLFVVMMDCYYNAIFIANCLVINKCI